MIVVKSRALKLILVLGTLAPLIFAGTAEAKSYKAPSASRNYKSGGQVYVQKGYYKPSQNKYVAPHLKTKADSYKSNNLKSRH